MGTPRNIMCRRGGLCSCVRVRRRDWAGFGSNKRGTPAESERNVERARMARGDNELHGREKPGGHRGAGTGVSMRVQVQVPQRL